VAATAGRLSAAVHERKTRARRTEEVLGRLDRECTADRRRDLVNQLICLNMGVAESIAARYRRRGISDDDLNQVAYLALVRAANAYDHSRGHDFLSYAVPCIRGEVRRHFRDRGWMVRPPRRVQETQARITAADPGLSSDLGHPPSDGELATHLGESTEMVREANAAKGCFSPTSLEQPASGSEKASIGDQLGHEDEGLEAAEARVILAPAVRRLGDRERRILDMRYFEDCTQQEIADEIGVTQMQVSRLLSGMMQRLRRELVDPVDLTSQR